MAKKESSKRGYMTPEEVEAHLRKYTTSDDKLRYLGKIRRGIQTHPNLVSDKTKRAVYENMGKIYEEEGRYLGNAKHDYELAGKPEKAIKMYEKNGYFESAGHMRRDIGDLRGALTDFERELETNKKLTSHQRYELEQLIFETRKEAKMRTSKTASVAASILAIAGGIFLLSPSLTGNVIGISNSTSNFLGAGLILIGLVAGFFWMKNKKQ